MLKFRAVGGVAVTLALVLVATSCGGDADAAEVNRSEAAPVDIELVLKGDVNVAFRGVVESHFVVRRTKLKDQQAQKSQVVGAEPTAPVQVDASAVLAGVAVMPYEGDGTYTIPVGSAMDAVHMAQQASEGLTVGSSIKVEWWPNGPDGESELFFRRARPCEVTVKQEGTQGSVFCPDVTDEDQRKHFSMTFRWKAPRTPAPPPPSP